MLPYIALFLARGIDVVQAQQVRTLASLFDGRPAEYLVYRATDRS